MNSAWKIILATLVIFGAGVVTGGVVVAHSQRVKQRELFWQFRQAVTRPQPGNVTAPGERRQQPNANPSFPQQARLELLRRIEREMTLTSGQREKIEAIIREGQERTREIMQPVQPQLQKEMRVTQERIRDILTEEQRARFDELMKMRPQRRADDPSQPERRNREPRRPFPPPDSNGEPRPDGQPPQREN
ncbi:MAG: hypothetical protein EPO07_08640 [Verrucomicrobia bacterium]|nr:MAG: hypothetical protein EPO07_08640 [Verrucomicrobiota bacterium]